MCARMNPRRENFNKKVVSFYLLLGIIVIISIIFLPTVRSNPLPAPLETYVGNTFFLNNSLYLLDANVKFDVDCTDFRNNISIIFRANYTIYNTNDTKKYVFIAPFAFPSLETPNFMVRCNGSLANFTVIDEWDVEEYNYLADYNPMFPWSLVLCNYTFKQNTTLLLTYQFNRTQPNPVYIGYSEFSVNYILETSKAWNQTMTEKLEFDVWGQQPDSHVENCTIFPYENGTKYLWEWQDEEIDLDYVGITFLKPPDPMILIVILIIILSLIALATTIIILVSIRKRNRSPGRIHTF